MIPYSEFHLTARQIASVKETNQRRAIQAHIKAHGVEPSQSAIDSFYTATSEDLERYRRIYYSIYCRNGIVPSEDTGSTIDDETGNTIDSGSTVDSGDTEERWSNSQVVNGMLWKYGIKNTTGKMSVKCGIYEWNDDEEIETIKQYYGSDYHVSFSSLQVDIIQTKDAATNLINRAFVVRFVKSYVYNEEHRDTERIWVYMSAMPSDNTSKKLENVTGETVVSWYNSFAIGNPPNVKAIFMHPFLIATLYDYDGNVIFSDGVIPYTSYNYYNSDLYYEHILYIDEYSSYSVQRSSNGELIWVAYWDNRKTAPFVRNEDGFIIFEKSPWIASWEIEIPEEIINDGYERMLDTPSVTNVTENGDCIFNLRFASYDNRSVSILIRLTVEDEEMNGQPSYEITSSTFTNAD